MVYVHYSTLFSDIQVQAIYHTNVTDMWHVLVALQIHFSNSFKIKQ